MKIMSNAERRVIEVIAWAPWGLLVAVLFWGTAIHGW